MSPEDEITEQEIQLALNDWSGSISECFEKYIEDVNGLGRVRWIHHDSDVPK